MAVWLCSLQQLTFCRPAGISAVLFETRLGCLQEEIPADTLRFIAAVNDMLTLSDQVVLLPRWSRGLLPFWGRFVQAWDDLYGVGRSPAGLPETLNWSQ